MPDNKKLELTPQEREEAIGEISQLRSSTQFMAELIRTGNLGRDEAETHMNLIRQMHDQLAGILHTDALSRALENAYRSCREANAKVHDLEKQLGRDVTPAAAMSKLRQLEDWFQAWYQLCGWHYISLEYTPYGLKFGTSDDIEHPSEEPEQIMFGDRELAVKIAPCVPYEFLNYDLKKDTFHDHILDTQANHDNLEKLFARNFPGAKIFSFTSHLDGTDRLLRAEGTVPWEDIQKWHDEILEAASKLDRPTGKFYVEKNDLAVRLASKTYTSHADKRQLSEERTRIAWLRMVTGMWDQIMGILGSASQLSASAEISRPWPDGTVLSQKFYAGATRADIGKWFSDRFGCDYETDLEGEKP